MRNMEKSDDDANNGYNSQKMSEQAWTPQLVATRLEEAASTLRTLAGGGANPHQLPPNFAEVYPG